MRRGGRLKGKREERREGKMWSVCKTKENVNKKRRKTKQTKSPVLLHQLTQADTHRKVGAGVC